MTRSSHPLSVAVVVGMALALVGCQASPPDASGAARPRERELVDLRHRILEYAEQVKERDSYAPPTKRQQKALAEGVGELLEGDFRAAEKSLAAVDFRVTRLTDTASGRRYDEVAARGSGEEARWGRLYVTADAAVGWTVQVPHPVADRDTETLGVDLLEGTPRGALVLAGAHRTSGREDSADVAHRTDSAFHGIVLEFQKRNVPGMQIHGFARASDRPYEAILSTGVTEAAPAEAEGLADRLEDDGLRVCRGWSDRCPLEGTTNVQGKAAQKYGTAFVHVELAPRARGDGSVAGRARSALAALLSSWVKNGG
ncbi:hypothetical protein [Streptomyces sp. NPDC058872]|uniref:hypothetical protein n=1 Tax=Streptomyces sp. NPDC058872 TaxID=3346661 RepID=UPI00367C3AD9